MISEAFKRAVFADFDESKDRVDAVTEQTAQGLAVMSETVRHLFNHGPESWCLFCADASTKAGDEMSNGAYGKGEK